jgi:hypothetical protein
MKFDKSILQNVRKIYSDAVDFHVNWEVDSMESTIEKLRNHLKLNYEYLSDTAIERLLNCFSYNWK